MSEIDEKFAEYCHKMVFSQPINTNYHSDIAEKWMAEHDAMVRWQTLSEFREKINEYLIYSEWHGLVVTDDAINCVIDQMNENRLNCGENSDCDECEYFGRPSDAPETVEKDCMWSLLKEKGEEDLPPCVRRLKK